MNANQFWKLLLASGLLDPESIRQAYAESGLSNGVDAICSYLVANQLLTNWQCEKLREGKYKGFFLDDYKLLRHLRFGETSSTYLAEDLTSGECVAVTVTAPTIVPLRNGKPEYRVSKWLDG